MSRFRNYVAVIFLVLVGTTGESIFGSDLSFRLSLGYDYLSQQYSLDTTLDTLATSLALKTSYLDDIKGKLVVRYFPYEDRRLEFQTSLEQTAELLRMRFSTGYRGKWENIRLDFKNETDARKRVDGVEVAGETYLYNVSRTRLTYRASESLALKWLFRWDFVQFDSTESFVYDYHRLGGEFGMEKQFSGLSFLDGSLFIQNRQAPNQPQQNYNSFGFTGFYLGIFDSWELDVAGRLERKDYNQPNGESDFTRLELDGQGKISLGKSLFLRPELDLELTLFSSTDFLNYDYARNGASLLLGWEKSGFSFAAGPDFEQLGEQQSEFLETEDYLESGVKLTLDYTRGLTFIGLLESSTGYRNLRFETSLQSSFYYERINLISDIRLLPGLHLNGLLATEWEWHESAVDNNQLFLISSSLAYSF